MKILYDSKCDFCNFFVARIATPVLRDSIQILDVRSADARAILRQNGMQFVNYNTIYTIDGSTVKSKSAAIFHILGRTKQPGYRLMSLMSILPHYVTDAGYDLVAKHRYKISKVLKRFHLLAS